MLPVRLKISKGSRSFRLSFHMDLSFLHFRLSCDANYLIPTCAEHCVDKNDSTGHYNCNYQTGTKDCLEGWYGSCCLEKKKDCLPRNDQHGHYRCHPRTGDKICLNGWRDPLSDCTKSRYLRYFFTNVIPVFPLATYFLSCCWTIKVLQYERMGEFD